MAVDVLTETMAPFASVPRVAVAIDVNSQLLPVTAILAKTEAPVILLRMDFYATAQKALLVSYISSEI